MTLQKNHTDPKDDAHDKQKGYLLSRSNTTIQPATDSAAVDLIRSKVAKLYDTEPDAFIEEQEAEAAHHRSKHQEFIYNLNHSGKDLATIQTEWHNYYLSLPDDEKHAVWQEFYAGAQSAQQTTQTVADNLNDAEKLAVIRNQLAAAGTAADKAAKAQPAPDTRALDDIQKEVRKKATRKPRSRARQNLHSALFGLGVGAVALVVFLFGFFNEVIIAPFMQPARSSAATPLIVNSETVAANPDEPQVIIPKINVQIPVRYGATSTSEDAMQSELEKGVVHYPTTALPGQNGNTSFFGHSSNNIFNRGDYKFAFVLLHRLVPGDVFYITHEGKVYAYRVFDKKVVEPHQVEVLNPVEGHPATATLITCDPPGTTLRRLVIVADQISPNPSGNTEAQQVTTTAAANTEALAGNGPTLWSRFIDTAWGKVITVIVLLVATVGSFRLMNSGKPQKQKQ